MTNNESFGVKVFQQLIEVRKFYHRCVGLLGRRRLHLSTALGFPKCGCLQTFGMKMTIDVMVFDKTLQLIKIYRNVAPNRIIIALGGKYMIEIEAGSMWPFEQFKGCQGTIDNNKTESNERKSYEQLAHTLDSNVALWLCKPDRFI